MLIKSKHSFSLEEPMYLKEGYPGFIPHTTDCGLELQAMGPVRLQFQVWFLE